MGWDGAGGAHPVADTVTAISTALDAVVDCPLYGLGPEQCGDLLASVVALESRLAALRLRLVTAAELAGTAEHVGAPNTAAWLRANTRTDRATAGRAVKLAKSLDGEFALTGDALAAGRVSEEQARVIVRAVAALPSSVGTADRRQGEAHLIEQAAMFDPVELARLGRRLLEVIAPEEADRLLGEQLKREEARAGRRELFIRPDGQGGARLSGRLDAEGAAMLDAALDPLARPRPSDEEGPDPRTLGQRNADALVELARRALAGQCCAGGGLPETGGEAATVLVTLSLDALRTGLGAGLLPTGDVISAAAARRWACDAKLIPAVLDGESMPLDLGRARRLFTPAQRRALALRDGDGCAFPGCDRPGSWCDAHHLRHWADGGPTDLSNGVLLCGWHHQVIHRGEWAVVMGLDGRPDFHPPTWLDPARRPRRNTRHRLPGTR
jgi:Domain of unknown function (DUF222)